MHRSISSTFAIASGLCLLTACPPDPGTTTETGTGETASTTEDPGTTLTPTTVEPTTVEPTTGDPPTSTTEGTSTGDPETGTTTEDTDTTTGGVALCGKLGEVAGIESLVDGALGKILVDDRINGYFLNSDVDAGALRQCLVDQLGALAQCPGVEYGCQSMKEAHAGLKISTVDFMDFAGDFQAALEEHAAGQPDLTMADQEAIMGELGAMAGDIVEDPDNDMTVYQRVGRKPAIMTLVGHPGTPGSFVDNVAMDAAINGYFGNTDFERFNTCLTRQVSSIDGPVHYGLEVDAPDPADPGVTADDPCKDMATAHAGLVDPTDNMGIDINDFMALVTDLVTAMQTAAIAESDQMAILTVLGGMCEDILAPEFKNQCPSAQKTEVVEAQVDKPLTDDGYKGSLMTMTCQDLEVPPDAIDFIEAMQATVTLDHTWVGDLTIKIVNPAGDKTLTVLSRPGLAEIADDGSGGVGKGANVSQMFPLTFKNGATQPSEQMGTVGALTTNDTICEDDGVNPCEWAPAPGKGPGTNFDDFRGDLATGIWKVCASDAGMGDVGTLIAVQLTIQRVKFDPTP